MDEHGTMLAEYLPREKTGGLAKKPLPQRKEHIMKTSQFLIMVTVVALLASCATAAPDERKDGRQAMADDQESRAKADADFQKELADMVKPGEQEWTESEKRTAYDQVKLTKLVAITLGDADTRKRQAANAKQERQAWNDSAKRTDDARAELSKLGAVRDEQRGLVVTLADSVLFRSSQAILMHSAQGKLDEVAQALRSVRGRNLIVEGHTDSRGSATYNHSLSQRRADMVRAYLVQRGHPAERIQAIGRGEGSPIALSDSPEGLARNRRVEIVVEPESAIQPAGATGEGGR